MPQKSFFDPDSSQFATDAVRFAPLADRIRPKSIDQIVGQEHILAEGKLLRRLVDSRCPTSMIFYGPPGTGKTSLARILSTQINAEYVQLNAVTANVAQLREVIDQARVRLFNGGNRTILFIDEIHRFNKAQQDILMPDVESGVIILLGATTQNPSYSVIPALISRCTIFELNSVDEKSMAAIIDRALQDKEVGLGKYRVSLEEDAKSHLIRFANGDVRKVLNSLEIGVLSTTPNHDGRILFTIDVAVESSQKKIVYYDKQGDEHYDTASALIKSMRASDLDGSLYWLAKMIRAGEDPMFVVRRLIIFASEDIGNADPRALMIAAASLQSIAAIGMPESQYVLSQVVSYLATAKKSRVCAESISNALSKLDNHPVRRVPPELKNK